MQERLYTHTHTRGEQTCVTARGASAPPAAERVQHSNEAATDDAVRALTFCCSFIPATTAGTLQTQACAESCLTQADKASGRLLCMPTTH